MILETYHATLLFIFFLYFSIKPVYSEKVNLTGFRPIEVIWCTALSNTSVTTKVS